MGKNEVDSSSQDGLYITISQRAKKYSMASENPKIDQQEQETPPTSWTRLMSWRKAPIAQSTQPWPRAGDTFQLKNPSPLSSYSPANLG